MSRATERVLNLVMLAACIGAGSATEPSSLASRAKNAPAKVTVSPDTLALVPGDPGAAHCSVQTRSLDTLTTGCTWKSGDTSIVRVTTTVTRNMTVTAWKPGRTWVSAAASKFADSLWVTVTDTSKPAPPPDTTPPPPPPPPTCSGVAVTPSTIAGAVSAQPTGTTFCLAAGTYQNVSLTPKAGQRFMGARGSKAERLSVFDGGRTVVSAFKGTAATVVIQGLLVQHYGAGSGSSLTNLDVAISGQGSSGWQIVDNEVRENGGAGVQISTGSLIRRNYIHHNGWLGAVCGGSTGSNAVVDSNEVSYNNTRGIDPNWSAGGIKCVLTSNLTFRGNFVHHNAGHGLWCDNCSATTYYLGNRVEDNTFNGIYHEVSADAVIDGNQLARNGTSNRGGIWVDNSSNVEVRNNVVSGGANGLILIRQVSRPELPNRVLQNVYVHDNVVTFRSGDYLGGVQFVSDPSYFTTKGNHYDRNHYTGPAAFRWDANGNITWSQWRAAGQDPSGTVVP